MSTIEQAAKRLEQLKKAGVEPERIASPSPTFRRPEPEQRPVPEQVIDALESDMRRSEPHRTATPPPSPAAPADVSGHEAHTRRVSIDLERLQDAGMVTPDATRSQMADEFRVIKRPLLANVRGKPGATLKNANMIMVTSALPSEGKSFTALNLAMSIVMEMDNTVMLVDADVANPSILKLMGLPPAKGLLDILTNDKLQPADVILRTDVPKLSLLPAGSPHARATELLASDAMAQLVNEMALRYSDRIVIFDSPPLLPTTEARALAAHMGQVVMVVAADKTTHRSVAQALSTIEQCPVVMMLLNKATTSSEVGSYYGYGYGYGYDGAKSVRKGKRDGKRAANTA